MRIDYAQQYRDLWNQHWWWQSRRRFVFSLVQQLASAQQIHQILDVGCGDALFFDDLMTIAPTWGIEPDASLLSDENPYRHRIKVGPFAEPTASSRRYDLIIMLDVLEHIADDRHALRTVRSLLEPGGHAVITVPALQALWSVHDEANRHYRRYSQDLLRRRLGEQNLEVMQMGYYFAWTVIPFLLRRLLLPRGLTASRQAAYRVTIPASLVNRALRCISILDHALARRLPLPLGTSIYAVCRRGHGVEQPRAHASDANRTHDRSVAVAGAPC